MKYKDFNNYEVYPQEQVIISIKSGKPIKPSIKNGYVSYYLYKDGKKHFIKAHRIFWECVNGEIPDGYEIDHISTDGTDNRLENMKLVTHKENCNNPLTIEKYKTSNKINGSHAGLINRNDESKPINAFVYKTREFVGTFPSLREASRVLNVSQANISRNLRGCGKQEKGYTFEFV